MARVEVYNGHSSIVPVLFATYDPQWKPGMDNIRIKEEPLDSDASQHEHLGHDTTDDEARTSRDSRIVDHVGKKVTTSNTFITSHENYMAEGSSSACSNINKNHVEDSGVSSNNSRKKSTNAIAIQNHVEFGNNIRNRSLRTRTKSISVECDICYAIFSEKTVLRAHKNYYARGKLVCHLCKARFSIPIHLTSHRRSAHRGDDWSRFKFECNYCKLGFVKKQYLQRHIFHHHNINKILNSKKYRRRMKSNVGFEKILVDSEFSDHRRKRKHDNMMMVEPSQKKLALRRIHDEIDPLAEDRSDRIDQSCSDEKMNDLNPQHPVLKRKINNNTVEKTNETLTNLPVQPPLVKICAIPHEVEALLNDSNSSDDDLSTDSDDSVSFSDSEFSDMSCSTPRKKYSLRSASRLTDNWAILKKRFNCQRCHVRLERLRLPMSRDYPSTGDILNTANTEGNKTIQINSRPTVGMELKNLEWALKKLQANGEQAISTEENKDMSTDCQTTDESSDAVSVPPQKTPSEQPSTTKVLYISSLCQTRYTTKKKLVYHYLCFHTNPQYEECAVCRSQCGNLTELTEHLMQHCIEIPESSQETSPIDPKESCENSKEKYMCKGCKKKFWLVSCLKDHEKRCEILRMTNSSDNQQNNDEVTSNETSGSILRMRLIGNNDTANPSEPTTQESEKRTTLTLDCTVCHTTFRNAAKCSEHIKKYTPGTTKYYCGRCGTPFPSPSLLGAHTRSTHERESPPEIVCIICDQGFRDKSSLRQHMLHIHYDEIKVDPLNVMARIEWTHERTCRVCKLIFPDRKCYIEHSLYYFDDDIIECSTCHKTFISHATMLNHKKKAHLTKEMKKDQMYRCTFCDEGFIYPSDIYSHMYHIHNTVIPTDKNATMCGDHQESNRHGLLYRCQICDALFSTALLLNDHQLEYSNTGEYLCPDCPRRCKTRSLLEKHIKLTHKGPHNNDQMKCTICNEIFASKASWNCHEQHIHLSAKSDEQLSQIYTDKAFSNECAVAKITAINETENNSDPRTAHPIGIEYTCALCDEQFMSSTDLKTHSLNSGSLCVPNDATIVNTNFSIDSIYSVKLEDYEKLCNAKDDGINSIKLNELDEVPAITDRVTRSSVLDGSKKLKLKRSVEELNPFYVCEICQMTFPTRNSLTKHKRKYSNTGDYECEHCRRKFRSIEHFQIHNRKHTNRKYDSNTPSHFCITCDEKFASESSKIVHFAHIHHILLQRDPLCNYDVQRRHSTRQQTKMSYQTNLDSFLRCGPEGNKSAEFHENSDIGINLNIDQQAHLNSISMSQSSPITLNNIPVDTPDTVENPQNNSNMSLAVASNNSTNATEEKTTEPAENEEDEVEILQTVDGGQRQVIDTDARAVENVVVDHELEIVEEEEELVEVDVDILADIQTPRALCDICGDVFTNRNELIEHQKKTHDIDLNIDTLSDTQEEYIDIELISDDEVQHDVPSTNYNKTDLDIIFDSNCVHTHDETIPSACPLKPLRTYPKRNRLTCRICNSTFSNLNSLVKHLEKEHQTDSPEKVDNIQNPRVSSSSKICSPEGQTNLHYVQLCCQYCGKQFVNDQYLYTHIKNVHTDEYNITIDPVGKPASLQDSNSLDENFEQTDVTQDHLQTNKYTHSKLARVTIVKNTDVIKLIDDDSIPGNKHDAGINLPLNSINRKSARYARIIPISRLLRTAHSKLILPKTNAVLNNDTLR